MGHKTAGGVDAGDRAARAQEIGLSGCSGMR